MMLSDEDASLHLLSLSDDLLIHVATHLIPGLTSSAAQWSGIISFAATSTLCLEAVEEALIKRFPVMAAVRGNGSPAVWADLLGGLIEGGRGRWSACQTVRAVRAQKPGLQPVHSAPRVSGSSLCTFAENKLILFGGRSSGEAETSDAAYLVSVIWPRGIAMWDKIVGEQTSAPRPAARCYHTATMAAWDGDPSMVVFGGAGEGEGMFNDTWSLSAKPSWMWTRLAPQGTPPAPRSSHICVRWAEASSLIVHGGLGNDGVIGDVHLLQSLSATARSDSSGSAPPCVWRVLETSGASVRRAHHVGALVERTLLLFSGQDEHLLTVHNIAALDLGSATWQTVALPSDGPCDAPRDFTTSPGGQGWPPESTAAPVARIDAAAAALDGVGLVVFGGVGEDFGFVPPSNAWLIKDAHDSRPRHPIAAAPTSGGGGSGGAAYAGPSPPPRACLGLCADGLRVYLFGGFDGEADLDDLWCLSLLPRGFRAQPSATAANHAAGLANAAPWPGRSPAEMAQALKTAQEIKERHGRAARRVLHPTSGAARHNFTPIHVLVGRAACGGGFGDSDGGEEEVSCEAAMELVATLASAADDVPSW